MPGIDSLYFGGRIRADILRSFLLAPSMFKNKIDRATALLMAGSFVVYIVCFVCVFSKYPFDDAFIHMRVARNLTQLGQPYFNPGEAVMGTSPHFWISLLALCFRLVGPHVWVAVALECLFVTGVFIATVLVLRERFSWVIATAIAAWLVSAFLLNIGAGLMETPVAILFFLASILTLRNGRQGLFGFFPL